MTTRRLRRRPLSIREILGWASAHREATGQWPIKSSGAIVGAKFETWAQVDNALRNGLRDLPGGGSLAQLLAQQLGVRNVQNLPPLTVEQILQWADAHRERTGVWPTADSGTISDSGGEKWQSIDVALRNGARHLPGGSSLARELAEHRGVRNRKQAPPLTEEQILAWADAFHERTGLWPTSKSGPVLDAPGETWTGVTVAMRNGIRGMAGGSSLGLLLAEKRGVRNVWTLPNLSVPQILDWTDAFHERTGHWPVIKSGPIPEAPGETWTAVNHALRRGSRGLPGGISLAVLLALERGVRNQTSIPDLTRKQILAWADAHHRRTGKWPTQLSGSIPESPADTWMAVDMALRAGNRGLRRGSSLARLLAARRGRRNHVDLPPLSKKKILAWAHQHHARTRRWPTRHSGPVVDAPGERWDLINNALYAGYRGLAGGSSLVRLLMQKRGVRNDPLPLGPLTEEQIRRWAARHLERTGSLPKYYSGPIADAPDETWGGVDNAFQKGRRGLTRGCSLAKLLNEGRPARAAQRMGAIRIEQAVAANRRVD
jgi:hypothetical protein